MPRTLHLVCLATHIPVEIGDIVVIPGSAEFGTGRLAEISAAEVAIDLPLEAPEGRLRTSPEGAGLAYIDESLCAPRHGGGPIDHRDHAVFGPRRPTSRYGRVSLDQAARNIGRLGELGLTMDQMTEAMRLFERLAAS